MSDTLLNAWNRCRTALADAAGTRHVRLVAVSKTRTAACIRSLAALGQRDFGENYVQEALPKIAACADHDLTWHFIGPLQSNKCRDVATHFAWAQSVDRDKVIDALARHRPPNRPPLNVLIQVNIDDETSKSGCTPDAVPALADRVASHASLRLRGLMAIPAPHPDPHRRRGAFAAMRTLYDKLQARHADVDTLSMGMSDDWVEAIAEGATMVRIGTALFGPRVPHP